MVYLYLHIRSGETINVFVKIDDKIGRLKRTVKPKCKLTFVSDKTVTDNLKELKDKYVITPIDKASNNIAFICKRH